MAIWQRLIDIIDEGADALGAIFEWAAGVIGLGDAETRRQVAYTAAMIALSAKMAKADGVVTADEVATFRKLFIVPPGEERHVSRLFDLAKQDIAGFETYARRIAAFYGDDRDGLADVMDGLFVIASADGAVHPAEIAYLERVGVIFGFSEAAFEHLAARHVVPAEGDPYLVLGIARDAGLPAIRAHYRRLVAAHHPDRAVARGLPAEMVSIATERLAAINAAFERIERQHRVRPAPA